MPRTVRLYTQFKPAHYKLHISPSLNKLSFKGELELLGTMPKASRVIKLHARNLVISKIVNGNLSAKITASKDVITCTFPKAIPKGDTALKFFFSGKIKDNMHGLYVSHFKFHGKKQKLLATQLEADHARELLPCIDEPEAKATFELSLRVPKSLVAISNTPLKSQVTKGTMKQVVFECTPVMSTYLLAFVIGNLKRKQTKTRNGTVVAVYATPDNLKHTRYALETAVKTLDFYNQFFKIPYPLPKLDMVALPDFAAGAMENWGLVTYREELLLVDSKSSSLMTKQYVAIVIAHELAHQWFGNLVTMKWWTDLWLNEGFASWIEYLAVDSLFPEWNIWTQFVSNDYATALADDALANTHPVEVAINDPEEIQQVFDSISYQKGASVIRMLYDFLGRKAFQSGLTHYLTKFSYSNATTNDLWHSLEEKSGKKVSAFMSKWTSQPGFPLVSYKRTKNKFSFAQSQFLLSPIKRAKVKAKTVWPIPIDFVGSKDFYLLDSPKQTFSVKSSADWFKINSNEEGFYRTQYSPADLANLLDPIRRQQLNPSDRLGLLSDSFALTKAGIYSTETAMYLIDAYRYEDDYAVWEIIASSVVQIAKVFDEPNFEILINPYGQKLAKKQVDRLGWKIRPTDNHFDRLLRPVVLSLALRFGDSKAVSTATQLFGKHHLHPIHADLRGIVYSAVARYGGQSEYRALLSMYKSASSAEETNRIAGALCSFRNADQIQQSLSMINSSRVRLQEAPFWIGRLLLNKDSRYATWAWLENNWQWFANKFGSTYYAARVVNYLGMAFTSREMAKDIENFFKTRQTAGIKRPLQQALESIYTQAEWRKRDMESVRKYLKNN